MGKYDTETRTDEETRRDYGEMVKGDNAEFIIEYVECLRYLSTAEIGKALFLSRTLNSASVDAQILEAYLKNHPDLPNDMVVFITAAIKHKRSVAKVERVAVAVTKNPDLQDIPTQARRAITIAMCDPDDLAVLGIKVEPESN